MRYRRHEEQILALDKLMEHFEGELIDREPSGKSLNPCPLCEVMFRNEPGAQYTIPYACHYCVASIGGIHRGCLAVLDYYVETSKKRDKEISLCYIEALIDILVNWKDFLKADMKEER